MDNGQKPASPQPFNETHREAEGGYVRSTGDPGLTKREYIAIEAMKGLLSNQPVIDNEVKKVDSLLPAVIWKAVRKYLAEESFAIADVMLKEAENAERTGI